MTCIAYNSLIDIVKSAEALNPTPIFVQDLRPGALDETETEFLQLWRRQAQVIDLPWTKLAGFPDSATSKRPDWSLVDVETRAHGAPGHKTPRDARIEFVKGWAGSSLIVAQLIELRTVTAGAGVLLPDQVAVMSGILGFAGAFV